MHRLIAIHPDESGAGVVLGRAELRAHARSNLIGMGVLPLRLPADRRPEALGLRPTDEIEIDAPIDAIRPRGSVTVRIKRDRAEIDSFAAIAAIETSLECDILRAGGLLPLILRGKLS